MSKREYFVQNPNFNWFYSLDPIIINPASSPTELSSCIFSQTSNSVLIGDTDGNVTVYQLKNIGDDNKDDVSEKLKNLSE